MSVVLFSSLILQVVDFLKEVSARAWKAVITQLTAWVGGIALVWMGAHAVATKAIALPGTDMTLGKLDGWSIVLVGLLASSLGSTVVDVKQAIDNTDTASKPPLVP